MRHGRGQLTRHRAGDSAQPAAQGQWPTSIGHTEGSSKIGERARPSADARTAWVRGPTHATNGKFPQTRQILGHATGSGWGEGGGGGVLRVGVRFRAGGRRRGTRILLFRSGSAGCSFGPKGRGCDIKPEGYSHDSGSKPNPGKSPNKQNQRRKREKSAK